MHQHDSQEPLYLPSLDVALRLLDLHRALLDLFGTTPGDRTPGATLDIKARIETLVSSIELPEGYGPARAAMDRGCKYELISKDRRTGLTPEEEIERALIDARLGAYHYRVAQTPEGRARRRLIELSWMEILRRLTPEEWIELALLRESHPHAKREDSPAVKALRKTRERWRQ